MSKKKTIDVPEVPRSTVSTQPKPKWPIRIKLPGDTEYVIKREDCLVCITKARHIILNGKDHRTYRVPRKAVTTKKLFPFWEKLRNPKVLIEYKGDPAKISNKVAVIPGYSSV